MNFRKFSLFSICQLHNEVCLEQHPLNQHNSSLPFTDTHSEYINYFIHIWHEEIWTYGLRKTQLKSYYDLKVGVYCGEQRRKGKWGSVSHLLTATTISGGGRKTRCAREQQALCVGTDTFQIKVPHSKVKPRPAIARSSLVPALGEVPCLEITIAKLVPQSSDRGFFISFH